MGFSKVHIEVKIRIGWEGFPDAANTSLESIINEYGGENVETKEDGVFYRIWVPR